MIYLKKISLINLIAFFCTIPFAAPIPIPSDLQYPIFILCIFVFTWDLFLKKISLNPFEILFIFFGFFSFFYIYPSSDFEFSLFKRVGILFSFFIFYIFSRYWKDINPKYIIFGIYLNFFCCLIHYFFPLLWIEYLSFSVRNIVIESSVNANGRGVSGLTAEPSFLGGMSIFFILISYKLLEEKRINELKFLKLLFVSLIMIILSKSANAFFMLSLLAGFSFIFSGIKFWKKLFFFSLIILIFYYLVFYLDSGIRGLILMKVFFENPEYFFFLDDSVAMRVISLMTGYYSIIQGNLFGNGAGSLIYVAQDILMTAKVDVLFSNWVFNRAGGIWSSLGQYTVEFGLIFLIFIFLAFFKTTFIRSNLFIRANAFIFTLGTFSILFPPLWICLAITDSRIKTNEGGK